MPELALLGCSLVSLHFLWGILQSGPVLLDSSESKHCLPIEGSNCPRGGISYQSAKHFRSSLTEEGGKREGRPEGRGGRPDVVILADNMKSGASSDRASNFPQAAAAPAAGGGAVAGAAGAVVAASKHTSASASQFEEDILTM